MTLVILLSLIIGLVLGLLGGGGSVLAVPLLVYVQHIEAKTAIATALVMVGVTSLTAMVGHARRGTVCWKTGLVFAAAGVLGAYGGGRLAAHIPSGALLLLFGAIMLGTSYAMLLKRPEAVRTPVKSDASVCTAYMPILAILTDGVLVGGITGLVGAGGGFLIVPALNLLGGLPMHAAVGTSLLVLALNSTAALGGYISHVNLDWPLTGLITAAAVIGSLLGGLLSHRISPGSLKRVFGAFIMLVALYVLHRELPPNFMKEVKNRVMEHPEFLMGMATALGMALAYRLFAWVHAQGPRQRDSLSRMTPTLIPASGSANGHLEKP